MLVLASASPRRQELLRNAGISFEVQPAHINEDPLPNEKPKECAERLAREKAQAIARQRPKDVVLGADTIVVIDEQILGKPTDAADAARMLRLLSARTHQVITGVCLVVDGRCSVASETTSVKMSEISADEIATTSLPASQWTKRAHTRFKASRRVGFRASKGITAMWWDCQSRECGRCYGKVESTGGN